MEAKAELFALEKTGNYIFHGSPNGSIELFEPRQAMSHGKKDGEPCIAAAEYVDPAVFMAIFSGKVPCGWNSDSSDNFGFYLNQSDFKKIESENQPGYVYVFEKDAQNFKKHQVWEWRTHSNVKPWKKVKVSFSDLPKNIQLN